MPLLICVATIFAAIFYAIFGEWRILRIGLAMGVLGPIPGCFGLIFSKMPWALFVKSPVSNIVAWVGSSLGCALFGVPMFGPYCFVVGLLGGFLILKLPGRTMKVLSKKGATAPLITIRIPESSEPLLIVVLGALAAIPMILLGFRVEAISAASFWILCLLLFRKRIFRREVGH